MGTKKGLETRECTGERCKELARNRRIRGNDSLRAGQSLDVLASSSSLVSHPSSQQEAVSQELQNEKRSEELKSKAKG